MRPGVVRVNSGLILPGSLAAAGGGGGTSKSKELVNAPRLSHRVKPHVSYFGAGSIFGIARTIASQSRFTAARNDRYRRECVGSPISPIRNSCIRQDFVIFIRVS